MSMQADTYDKMVEHGWYQVDNVEETKIQETIMKLQSNNSESSEDNNEEDTEE
jgi:spore coat protein CotF